MPLGALYPSKSGLMNKHIVKHIGPVRQNKHIVKHIVAVASYLGFGTCCGSRRGQYFIFGALYPSMSGLMNKHS